MMVMVIVIVIVLLPNKEILFMTEEKLDGRGELQ